MNNRTALPVIAVFLSAPAIAYDRVETVPVMSTVPIYERISEPHQRCWTESVTVYPAPRRSAAGGILGGIAGGLLGAQVGKGNGRIAAAATGAAIGAIVGDRMDNRTTYAAPVNQPVERCQVTESVRTVVTGYEVTYRYAGRDSVVILPYDPGPTVRIGVQIVDAGPVAHHIGRNVPPGHARKAQRHGKPHWY
ncbi:MAG: glycine zipper 2TM domain-containing protein [Burkholderiales bacterium]